jgi:hypothetical protein
VVAVVAVFDGSSSETVSSSPCLSYKAHVGSGAVSMCLVSVCVRVLLDGASVIMSSGIGMMVVMAWMLGLGGGKSVAFLIQYKSFLSSI